MDKHVSSFERFLSEYKWSMHGVIASLVSLLSSHLGERLMVHGAFLVAEYTTFACKAGKKMIIEIYAARCLLLAGDCNRGFKAAFRLFRLSIYDLNRNSSVCNSAALLFVSGN